MILRTLGRGALALCLFGIGAWAVLALLHAGSDAGTLAPSPGPCHGRPHDRLRRGGPARPRDANGAGGFRRAHARGRRLVRHPRAPQRPLLDDRRVPGALGRDRRRPGHHPRGPSLRLAHRDRLHAAMGDAHGRPRRAGGSRPDRLVLDGRRHRARDGQLRVCRRPGPCGLDRDPEGGRRALFDCLGLLPPLRAGLRRRPTSAT